MTDASPAAGRYRAFISYSRADREQARALQRRLEGYVLPQAMRVVKAGLRHDPKPLRPVFRDEDELVPGQDLPSRIRKGLAEAEFLIVICSPAAAKSEWVEKEVADFMAMGRGDNILAIVVEGEPTAADRGLDPALECLPPSLRAVEPLWIDWRKAGDRERTNFLRLVAALLNFESLDQLIQRDRQAKRRQRMITALAASVALVATVGGGLFAWTASLAAAGPQTARFDTHMHRPDPDYEPGNPIDIKYEIIFVEDITGDGILDFIVRNESWGKCGSGGCPQELHIGNGLGGFTWMEDWLSWGGDVAYSVIAEDGDRDNLLIGRLDGGEYVYPYYIAYDQNPESGLFEAVEGWFCGSKNCEQYMEAAPTRVVFIPLPEDEAFEPDADPCPQVDGYVGEQPPMYISPIVFEREDSFGTARDQRWYQVDTTWSPFYFGSTADGVWHAYIDFKLDGFFFVKSEDCTAAPADMP